ncbi:hypothetical protein [Microcystis aeruginosa]|jgi:hypothetical protein|uniref:Uncharacterized protein n=1 Tax=Microcystis aeruginosa NIES-4285 TaxID=2497681 RepID=A0A402DL30_MICAE|nr:hypothetical protein [Microcystis aeruginosa]MBE9244464.1 hypothetical protein [Microcystis aeruginosa LEGE 00239]TYT72946.1 hypothetical protein FXO09_01045 [Microcystis aeruginosa KLA2]GCE62906.1 hypothetical protein MiAbB_04861 [Microcystis aeruginosa NIES-4285]
METFTKLAAQATVLMLIIGLIVYGILLFLFSVNVPSVVSLVSKWPPYAFDVPMSGIAAFAIVNLLPGTKDGSLAFEAFSLKFSGPAVPATLWIVVYLSLVVSFKL